MAHGGSGWSLSWGAGTIATGMAMATSVRRTQRKTLMSRPFLD
jgi:hypothetical protein